MDAVRICNMALSHIGARSVIESLLENSTEAKQCNLWYDFSRKQALAPIDWNFARKRQILALHSDAADMIEWNFRYKLPVDNIVIRTLVNPAGPKVAAVPFKIETSNSGVEKTLLTNLSSAVALYTFDQTNTNLFTEPFIEALSYLLAHHICFTLTGKADMKEKLLGAYFVMLRQAGASASNEQVADAPKEAEWISGR